MSILAMQRNRNIKRQSLKAELADLGALPMLKPVRIQFYKMSSEHPLLHVEYVNEVESETDCAESYIGLRREALQKFVLLSYGKMPKATAENAGNAGDSVTWQLEWKDLDNNQHEEMTSLLVDLRKARSAYMKAYDKRARKQLEIRKKIEEERKTLKARLAAVDSLLREDGARY